ncbi:MAG: 23S rRNA (guanosine(2251)-2'-O)-methyltransferase RlmB [Clostridia bacterium]|nr:23S rRNA (guanosine(2251)-2'-O)-methyltransferase RlmB [Clostridia bacterium]
MLAEGKNPVVEALKSGVTIEKILVLDKTDDNVIREQIKIARDRGIRVEFVQRQALDRLSKTGHHQGIIAFTSEFEYSDLDDVMKNNTYEGRRFFILLDKLSDPHNLGSIIRTAECSGVTAVVIPNRNSVLVNETVMRASAGAINHVKVCKVGNLNDAIKKLKEDGVFVYVTDMDGENIYKTNLKGDIAIVIGSEGFGVSALTRKLADQVISIPMYGNINSLNASVSAGICMYEAVRQDKF